MKSTIYISLDAHSSEPIGIRELQFSLADILESRKLNDMPHLLIRNLKIIDEDELIDTIEQRQKCRYRVKVKKLIGAFMLSIYFSYSAMTYSFLKWDITDWTVENRITSLVMAAIFFVVLSIYIRAIKFSID